MYSIATKGGLVGQPVIKVSSTVLVLNIYEDLIKLEVRQPLKTFKGLI
jgi:hypothetical protein